MTETIQTAASSHAERIGSLRRRFDADDLRQETALRLLQGGQTNAHVGVVYAAVRCTAHSVMREHCGGRRDHRRDECLVSLKAYCPRHTDPAAEIEMREDIERALSLLGDLREPTQSIVRMRFLGGQRIIDIAAHFGMTANAVEIRLRRAILQMRQAMQPA